MDFAAHAFAAFWLVLVVRSLPWVQRQVVEQRKPWACDPCLAVWCALPLAAMPVGGGWAWAALRTAGAAGAAVLLLELQRSLVGPDVTPALPPGPVDKTWERDRGTR